MRKHPGLRRPSAAPFLIPALSDLSIVCFAYMVVEWIFIHFVVIA